LLFFPRALPLTPFLEWNINMIDHPIPGVHQTARASPFRPFGERRFAPIFWTHVFGVMNDSLFSIGFMSLVAYQTVRFSNAGLRIAWYLPAAMFVASLVLFSAASGQIADKYDKAMLVRLVKTVEIVITVVGAGAFWWHSVPLLLLCVFLMGARSTLFMPVMDAYLPQQLGNGELVGGNGLVQTGTFIAAPIGIVACGVITRFEAHSGEILACTCVAIAVAGRVASGFVPASTASPQDAPIHWNPIGETRRNLALARENAVVILGLVGIAWLWFVATTVLFACIFLAKDVLTINAAVVTVVLMTLSTGVSTGALLCERLSRRRVELYLVLPGSIGMSFFAFDLYFTSQALAQSSHLLPVGEFRGVAAHWRGLVDVFMFAMFSALYSVPLHALLQRRSTPTHRGRIVATCNTLKALALIAAAAMALALIASGVGFTGLFLVAALLCTVASIYLMARFPAYLVHFIVSLVVRAAYRVQTAHRERIPDEGAAILVCNHVSYVDPFVIEALSPRPIRFVMSHRIFQKPLGNWFFRLTDAIPIASGPEDTALLASAYEQCVQALANGELVCIFPEGKRSPTGAVSRFQPGVRKILRRAPAPVVPMALQGLWGSVFSRNVDARVPRPMRKGVRSRITLAVGEPVEPVDATPLRLQQIVEMLHRAHYDPSQP
jgi:1-acyl-sn-glycerol-3-phosphate acyltransferase